MKKLQAAFIALCILMLSALALAPGLQAETADQQKTSAAVAPAPQRDAVLYKVAGVVLVVWAGIAFQLVRTERKIKALEKELHEL